MDDGLHHVADALDHAAPWEPEAGDPGPGAPDMGQEQGGGRERRPFFARLPDGWPVVPLGLIGDTYWYLDAIGQLRDLKAKDHSRLNVQALMGPYVDRLREAYPRFDKSGEVVGWKPEDAAEALMTACADIGVWSPLNRVRGAGAWLNRDGGLVLHCGDRLWFGPGKGKRGGGTWCDPGAQGGFVYPTAPAMQRPADGRAPPAAKDVGHEILSIFRTWNWTRGETDAVLLLGWLAAGMLGGALHWRPVVWVTGSKGTGKSTLSEKLLPGIFGEGGALEITDPTEASIRQMLKWASLPVLIDEAEAEEDNRRLNAMVKLARLASSGGRITRGGADGQASEFVIRSCFLFSSILMPPLLTQDRSRMAILHLKPLAGGGRMPDLTPARLDKLGQALRRRLVEQWHRFAQTLDLYRQALEGSGHTARGADQFGTLLACADLCLYDQVPDSDSLAIWGERLQAPDLAELQDDEADETRCLAHLVTTQLDLWRQGQRLTLGHWVLKAAAEEGYYVGEEDLAAVNQALTQYGVKVIRETKRRVDGKDVQVQGRWMAVANYHTALAKLFEGTHWAGRSSTMGNWVQSLRNLPGAFGPRKAEHMGTSVKVTCVPIELLRVPAETGDSPAPTQSNVSTTAGGGAGHPAPAPGEAGGDAAWSMPPTLEMEEPPPFDPDDPGWSPP